jgi:AAA ATPase domain
MTVERKSPRPLPRLRESLVGRENEAADLRRGFHERQSLLLVGAAGSGKTALVSRVLEELRNARCFYLSAPSGLHGLLRMLVRKLYAAGDKTLRAQLRAERVSAQDFARWLRAQSSSRLKGALYRAVEAREYSIILDHAPALTAAEAKVLQELALMRSTPIYFLARPEDKRALALVSKIYWNPAWRLRLGPLPPRAARELVEHAIRRHGLDRFELAGFRPKILRLSGRLPGAIVEMCALAAEPRYRYGERIKTNVLYVNFRTAGSTRP